MAKIKNRQWWERKVCLSFPRGVSWARLKHDSMTRQSAGQWSEEAAGMKKESALMYSGDDRIVYCLAYKTMRK